MKRFLNNIYEFFFFLVRPSYWLMIYSYDEILDIQLRRDLDIGFVNCDHYYAKIGENIYWVANYPYAYGGIDFIDARPSRMTVYKTRKAQIAFYLKDKKDLK